MTRSVWKGPFVDGYLLKKADAARNSGRKDVIKIWSRRSTILPQFVGLTSDRRSAALELGLVSTDGNNKRSGVHERLRIAARCATRLTYCVRRCSEVVD